MKNIGLFILLCLCMVSKKNYGQLPLPVTNPSFEYEPALPLGTNAPGTAPEFWNTGSFYFDCPGTCSIEPSPDGYPSDFDTGPTEGDDYMGVIGTVTSPGGVNGGEAIYQEMPCPMLAGVEYSIDIDVKLRNLFFLGPDSPLSFGVFGANIIPASGEFEEPEILDTEYIDWTDWETITLTFTPSIDYSVLIIGAYMAEGGFLGSYVYFDNMINTVTTCELTVELDDTTTCAGDCVEIIPEIILGTGPDYSYEWLGSALTTPSITVCPLADTTVTVLVTDLATLETDTASATITVTDCGWGVALTDSTICEGFCVDVSPEFTGVVGLVDYSFEWLGTGVTDSSITICTLVDTIVTVVVTDLTTLETDTASAVISVTDCGWGVTLVDSTICEGSCIEISPEITAGIGPDYSYEWIGATVTTPSLVVCPMTDTTITVVVTDLGTGLTDTASTVISVTPEVVVIASLDTVVCAGQTVSLTATGAATYSWGAGVLSDTYLVTPTATTDYVVVGAIGGCFGTDTVTVTVIESPVAIVSVNNPACFGDENGSIIIEDIVGGTPGYVIEWDGLSGGDSLLDLSNGTYSLSITDGVGCSYDSVYALISSEEIFVSILGDLTLCEGENGVLTAVITGGAAGYSLLWNESVPGFEFLVSTSEASFDVLVEVTDANNCNAYDSTLINISPSPNANFDIDLSGCAPFDVSIDNLSTMADSYLWDFGNGLTSGIENPTTVYETAGIYDIGLIVYTTEGCSDTLFLEEAVKVDAVPELTAYTTNSTVFVSEPTVFYGTQENSDNCEVQFGDGETYDGCDWDPLTHVYSELGQKEVLFIATNNGECADSLKLTINVVEEANVYVPNCFTPDGNAVNNVFKPIVIGVEDYHLTVFNRWGEILFESYNSEVGWDGTYGGSLCSDGVYIWKIVYNSSENTTGPRELMGHITLLR